MGKEQAAEMCRMLLVLVFCAVFSLTSADFAGSKQENASTQIQPVLVLPIVSTSLATEYNTDYYRTNDRRVTRRPISNRRPPQNKASINWDQSDTCGGNILIPLSDDNALVEETYQSTGFPVARTYPLICSWNFIVSKNCRHARIVLRIDRRSRLPIEKECNKGYFRVLPFMREAKICGRVGDVAPLQWHVENEKPEVVTVTMRNPGLEDEKSAGFSFSLRGECLPYEWMNGSMNTTSLWLHQMWKDSAAMVGPTVVIPGVNFSSIFPWMKTQPSGINTVISSHSSGLTIAGTLPPNSTLDAMAVVANLNRPPTRRPLFNRVRTRPTRRPNIRRPITTIRSVITRPTSARPISWAQYDTCGGVINVPLLFDRLSLYESSYFVTGRQFPLVCNWNVKVNPLCRRARVTMRVGVGSRLADVEGCVKGYYTVSPLMGEAKICGRIGTVPPFQWYVDEQRPEDVTVFMENIGLNDGRSEGLSFSLQSECIQIKSDNKKIDVSIQNYWSNSRWMNRVREESAKGDGPRVVIPGAFSSTATSSSSSSSETTNPSTGPENQSEIPWLILKSPDQNQPFTTVSLYTEDSKNTLESPNISSNHIQSTPVSVIQQSSDTNPKFATAQSIGTTTKIAITPLVSLVNKDIPWVFLKSPNENPSTTGTYRLATLLHSTTTRRATQRLPTSPSITVLTSIHPTSLSRPPTQTISKATIIARSTATTKKSTTRSPSKRRSTTIHPPIRQPTMIRSPTTESISAAIRGPTTITKRPPTVHTSKSSSTAHPASPVIGPTNTGVPRKSELDIHSDVVIQEAISYVSSLLEETKKRNNLPSTGL